MAEREKVWQYVKASEIVSGDVTRRGEIAATIVSLVRTRTLAFVGGAPKLTISDHAPIEVLR